MLPMMMMMMMMTILLAREMIMMIIMMKMVIEVTTVLHGDSVDDGVSHVIFMLSSTPMSSRSSENLLECA
jgi:hypothetical protein